MTNDTNPTLTNDTLYHKRLIDAQTQALAEHPSVAMERDDEISDETYTNYLLWALERAIEEGDVNSADDYATELDTLGVEWRGERDA